MGFKEYEKSMSFLDMELSKTLGTSRTQRVLKEIHDHIRREPLERILLADYPEGKSPVGNAAYPPVMLLKALLLQKWFGISISSDPELENQINDRVSFKVFIGLTLGDAADILRDYGLVHHVDSKDYGLLAQALDQAYQRFKNAHQANFSPDIDTRISRYDARYQTEILAGMFNELVRCFYLISP